MQVVETVTFAKWLKGLRDPLGKRAILRRISRIAAMGSFGDHAGVGGGVSELRVDVGPGYRVYYVIRGEVMVLLLCGGDKDSQVRDIEKAKKKAAEVQ